MTSTEQQAVRSLDELGPVDYVVIEFPAGKSSFTGEMAKELLALVDAGTIRVIDILILAKSEDGSIDAIELSDVGELGELQASRPSSRSSWPRRTSCTSPPPWIQAAWRACLSTRTCGRRHLRRQRVLGRSADRERTDPDPGHHRFDRSRRSTRRRRLSAGTCSTRWEGRCDRSAGREDGRSGQGRLSRAVARGQDGGCRRRGDTGTGRPPPNLSRRSAQRQDHVPLRPQQGEGVLVSDQTIDRTTLPIRRPEFSGTVGRTLDGSEPDWEFVAPTLPPEGAPNILLVLTDDAGFGNPSTFGGRSAPRRSIGSLVRASSTTASTRPHSARRRGRR